MITSIFTIIAGLFTLLLFLVKRRNDPKYQLQKKLDENDQAISHGDVNQLLDDRLRQTSADNSSGQDSNPS